MGNQHDVFVSFRGRDVRYKFVDHLFAALRRNKVTAFRDDRNLRRGESIEDGVRRAIEKSSFYVVVLTPNYTSSPWCLDELVKMMKCSTSSRSRERSSRSKMIFLIFYHVAPEDVSQYCYREVDGVNQNEIPSTKERADTWVKALDWIVGIAGWVVNNGQSEASLVESIARIMRRNFRTVVARRWLKKSRAGNGKRKPINRNKRRKFQSGSLRKPSKCKTCQRLQIQSCTFQPLIPRIK